MSKPNTDHVVVSLERGAFECLHCGTSHRIASPLLAEVYLSQGRGFLWMHKLCRPTPPPERQLSLPNTDGELALERETVQREIEEAEVAADGGNGHIQEDTTPGPYDKFDELYPAATDVGGLWHRLRRLLTPEQWEKMPAYCPWRADSGVFDAVANWARIERAHRESEERGRKGEPGIGGLTIPARVPMPAKLRELIEPKKDRLKRRRAGAER